MDDIFIGEFSICHSPEFVVIIPEHAYIKVIIPRHKAAVSDSTKKSAPICKIADAMLAADTVDFAKNDKLCSQGLFNGGWYVETISDLIFKKSILWFIMRHS